MIRTSLHQSVFLLCYVLELREDKETVSVCSRNTLFHYYYAEIFLLPLVFIVQQYISTIPCLPCLSASTGPRFFSHSSCSRETSNEHLQPRARNQNKSEVLNDFSRRLTGKLQISTNPLLAITNNQRNRVRSSCPSPVPRVLQDLLCVLESNQPSEASSCRSEMMFI